jgi:ribosomal protein S18 acetylase RimI-like enzyme
VIVDRIPGAELGLRMMVHEAEAQQTPDRRLRDLGDGWLLHDAGDAEPFWTRLIAPRWPDAAAPFDRRLGEIVTLFATLDRLPHIRLELAAAWERDDRARRWPGPLTLARYGRDADRRGVERRRWAEQTSLVLSEAFAVDPLRRTLLEGDALACVVRPGCTILLLRVGDQPVAVARLAWAGEGAYLSSIGVRPAWRRRGYGALVTALGVAEAVAAGCRLVHLAVDVDNTAARLLYEGLAFEVIGEPVPDLLLR